jgi:hypothetical protein
MREGAGDDGGDGSEVMERVDADARNGLGGSAAPEDE